MGYPMHWGRLCRRNNLVGQYGTLPIQHEHAQWTPEDARNAICNLIAGDMRRVEEDQRDEYHLAEYARRTGLTPEQCRAVLDAFFTGDF